MNERVERVTHRGLDERVVVLRAGDEVDAVFVRTERFCVLVDTLSTPDLCRQALDLVAAERAGRPLLVVNSHMDWDHVWGNAALPPGTVIIAQTAALDRFHQPETAATLRDMAAREARFAGIELVAPTIGFAGAMRLEGGDLTLHLLHTPGHTPDHLAVWIPEIRTCLGVDAVEDPIPEVWSTALGDLRALCVSLQRIADLKAAILLPAHGGTSDPGLAARNLAYFDALAARVAGAGIEDSNDESDLAVRPGLRFEDLVPACRAMTAEMRTFYRGVHARNLAATVAAHRAAGGRPSV